MTSSASQPLADDTRSFNNPLPSVLPTNQAPPNTPKKNSPVYNDEYIDGFVKTNLMIPAKAVSLMTKAAKGIIDIISALKPVTTIDALKIASKVTPLFVLPFDVCSLISSACDIESSKRLYRTLSDVVTKCRADSALETKQQAMKSALDKLEEEDDADSLGKTLNISTSGKKSLKDRMRQIRSRIDSPTEEDVTFVRNLAARVNRQIWSNQISVAISAFAICSGILAAIPIPVGVQVAAAAIYTACAVASIALWVFNDLCTNRNPFDATSHSIVESAWNNVARNARLIAHRFQDMFCHEKKKFESVLVSA